MKSLTAEKLGKHGKGFSKDVRNNEGLLVLTLNNV